MPWHDAQSCAAWRACAPKAGGMPWQVVQLVVVGVVGDTVTGDVQAGSDDPNTWRVIDLVTEVPSKV